ncbi:MAG TPA: DUF748 domain-containing protein [Deltaproteobacteria bacterium]|nr:DUF748 domain-containing protein [Deltaproteobacteria bacterium]HXK46639.1 DUF748 domain-containing protein [Deltaproteobacteria bacterium]
MHKNRTALLVLILAVALTVCVAAGYRVAVHALKGKVEQALGPDSEVGAIHVGWSGVTVEGLRIKGKGQWPAGDTIRADRVDIVPSLLSLFSDRYRIRSITVSKPYLSVLKTRNGRVLVVPGLLKGEDGRKETEEPAGKQNLTIGRITLDDGEIEFFDASVANPPLRIDIEKINATVEDLAIPALTGRSAFELSGVVKGADRDGRVVLSGWSEIATKDSSVRMQLLSVDLVKLQPYISKTGDTKVRKGILDLDIRSEVRDNRLKAPGRLVISNLELGPSKGLFGTFLGVPRDAVLTFMKGRDGRISLDFTLEGDLNNPRFTLHEAFSERIAASLAETLGVGVKGLAEGAGSLGQKGVDAAGEVVKGIGGALNQIMGGKKD